MSDCGCHVESPNDAERRILRIALTLNALMFVVGAAAGLWAQSMGLIADSLDMLADASAYSLALVALHRSVRFRATAANSSGIMLLLLGLAALGGVAWHLTTGSQPEGYWILSVAFVSLIVNATVLRLLGRFRHGQVHLRATWLFTRVDVIANLAVIMSGVLVLLLQSAIPDLVIGTAIGGYVIKEAIGILHEAREVRADPSHRKTPWVTDGEGRSEQ